MELVIKTSDLYRLAFDSALSSSFPALPMKGIPVRSSSLPGASPINMISAREGPGAEKPNNLRIQSSYMCHVREMRTPHEATAKLSRELPFP
jgi:hypothetical protein